MLGYKVVDKETRRGSNYSWVNYCGSEFEKKFIKTHLRWFPRYVLNKITRMKPNSVGLIVFSERRFADKFLDLYNYQLAMAMIIEVEYLKEDLLREQQLIQGCGSNPSGLEKAYEYMYPPSGSIFLKKVKVIS